MNKKRCQKCYALNKKGSDKSKMCSKCEKQLASSGTSPAPLRKVATATQVPKKPGKYTNLSIKKCIVYLVKFICVLAELSSIMKRQREGRTVQNNARLTWAVRTSTCSKCGVDVVDGHLCALCVSELLKVEAQSSYDELPVEVESSK